MTTTVEVVEQMFASYLKQDQGGSRATGRRRPGVHQSAGRSHRSRNILREVFPTASRVKWQELRRIVPASDEDVFVMYEYELVSGGVHRNSELITVRDGKVAEIQVFFGGAVRAG